MREKNKTNLKKQEQPENHIRDDINDEQRERHCSHFKQVRSDGDYSSRHDKGEVTGKQVGRRLQQAVALLVLR